MQKIDLKGRTLRGLSKKFSESAAAKTTYAATFQIIPTGWCRWRNPGFAALSGVLKSGDFMQKYALFEE
jgi:hypothetical protein